jgi:hypothetical protein
MALHGSDYKRGNAGSRNWVDCQNRRGQSGRLGSDFQVDC